MLPKVISVVKWNIVKKTCFFMLIEKLISIIKLLMLSLLCAKNKILYSMHNHKNLMYATFRCKFMK